MLKPLRNLNNKGRNSEVIRLQPGTIDKLDAFVDGINRQIILHGYHPVTRSLILNFIVDEGIKNFNLEHFIKLNTEEVNSHE